MNRAFNTKEAVEKYLESDRWSYIKRDYSSHSICSLRPSLKVEHTLSEIGSRSLLGLLERKNEWVSGLGAATAQQALQMFHLDYEIIYVSGWQVAAESNTGVNTYPDLSLYPSNSTPNFVEKINNTLLKRMADLNKDKLPPIIADGESGFGGIYNVYELTNQFINAGASAIHFEDQLASEKKCGHVGGKVIIPTHEYIKKINSSRLASDVLGVPIIIIARTDALNAKLMTSDYDDRDRKYLSKNRTSDGYFQIEKNHELAISKSLSYSEYADVIWCETNTPDLGFAKEFADEIKRSFPNKILAYNCSPSFNWLDKFTKKEVENFQNNLNDFGYKLQFVSLAGFHSLASSMYDLANKYKGGNMSAIIELQEFEKKLSKEGYTGIRHQQEVGGNYYEKIGEALLGESSELLSKKDSTENTQF